MKCKIPGLRPWNFTSIVTWRDYYNGLKITTSPSKTQAMIVNKSNYNYRLFLKSNNILTIDELELLGVTIDNKLTFSSHIKLTLSKIHAKIAALRRIRNFIDSDTALKLYKSYIFPHFDYCSPLLLGINQTLSDK